MKKMLYVFFIIISLCVLINAQSTNTQAQSNLNSVSKTKRPTFRANKDQISAAQKRLKLTETGKLSTEDKAVLKAFQKENGLRSTGSLNRATLEKMGIALTDKQKEIPVDPNSFLKVKSNDTTPRKAVFKATKDQVTQAQKRVSVNETGKLDDTTREALKKFQAENGLKATGTLNKDTLVKMGIELTDKQKEK
jgi:peptidoglycan hydrolase-like protein with peptidoglycan-binding domain